jgi:hypothetical protein
LAICSTKLVTKPCFQANQKTPGNWGLFLCPKRNSLLLLKVCHSSFSKD